MIKKLILALVALILIAVVGAFIFYSWLSKNAFYGTASSSNITKEFEIKEGDGSKVIGSKLESEGLIKDKNFFYFYIWKTDTGGSLQAGTYEVAPNMTIGEMVAMFSDGKIIEKTVKLTIPEGFTNKKIIAALEKKRPELVAEFSKIVSCKCLNESECDCDQFSQKHEALQQIPAGVDMEGYLFPDTYFIDDEETGATMVSKFLNNFDKKVNQELRKEIIAQGKTLHEIITMASIIERETRTDEDRKIVSGIFWDRLRDDFPLQSCATLAYFLDVDKMQFSYEETQIESPYNTYRYPGMPPGPIANPGIASIKAAVYPQQTEYYYFLSNPETGKMFYSVDLEEHNRKKAENGL
jgi:UPF0755 protein